MTSLFAFCDWDLNTAAFFPTIGILAMTQIGHPFSRGPSARTPRKRSAVLGTKTAGFLAPNRDIQKHADSGSPHVTNRLVPL